MYTLNFSNGMSHTYASLSDLTKAARDMGGRAKIVQGKTYVFIPKK